MWEHYYHFPSFNTAAADMTDTVVLNCLLIGQDPPFKHIFTVEMSHTKTIGQLKEAILDKRMSWHNKYNLDDLTLYTAKERIPTENKEQFNKIIDEMKYSILDIILNELNPSRTIAKSGLEAPEEESLHIIIVPSESDEGHDVTTEFLANKPPSGLSGSLLGLRTEYTKGSKRPRLDESDIATALWDSMWNVNGDDVPFCTLSPVERDGTLRDFTVPTSCWMMKLPANFKDIMYTDSSRFLIRDDYIGALRSLFEAAGLNTSKVRDLDLTAGYTNPFLAEPTHVTECDEPQGGFILTGHPGIGKSTWLSFLLLLRLHAKLPTFYQYRADKVLHFSEHGVQSFNTLGAFYALADNTPDAWVLVDSNENLKSVDAVYCKKGLFVVQTPSPRADRMEWVKKTSVQIEYFILKPWSLSELLCGRLLQRKEVPEDKLALFFAKYGPSARLAYQHAGNKRDNFGPVLYEECRSLTLEELQTIASQGVQLNYDHKISHKIILLYPGSGRYFPEVRFPSDHICEMVVTALRAKNADAATQLCAYFNSSVHTKAGAGNIFEVLVHITFGKGGDFHIFPLKKVPKTPQAKNQHWKLDEHPQTIFLHINSNGITINQQEHEQLTAQPLSFNFFIPTITALQTGYYKPLLRNQATFDAFIYDATTNHAILIQATVLEKHSVKIEGITQLERLGVTTFTYLIATPPDTPVDLPFPLVIDQKIKHVYHFILPLQVSSGNLNIVS